MNNMIEKVASSLFEAFKNNNSQYMMDKLGFLAIKFNQLDTDNRYRKMFLAQAKIAIEAMREPSEKMIETVGKRDLATGEIDDEFITDYQAMIDEALKE